MKGAASFGRGGRTSDASRELSGFESLAYAARHAAPATVGLLGFFVVAMIFQVILTGEIRTTPGARTMLGGINYYFVTEQQQWWRIFTAPLFHRSPGHFLLNSLAIGLGSYFVEKAWGWRAVLLLFLVGAIAGSFFSLAFYSDIYTNASGQAGAFASACVLAGLREEKKNYRKAMIAGAIAALMAIAALTADGIYGVMNFFPLLGGTISAFLLAPLFMKTESDLAAIKKGLLAILAVFYAASLGVSFWNHDHYSALIKSQVPDGELPSSSNFLDSDSNVQEQRLMRLTEKYPKDPLPHLYLGLQYYALLKNELAVSHLRQGLRQEEFLQTQYMPIVRRTLRQFLVLTLIQQGNIPEAKAVAGPRCREMAMITGSRVWKKTVQAGVCS